MVLRACIDVLGVVRIDVETESTVEVLPDPGASAPLPAHEAGVEIREVTVTRSGPPARPALSEGRQRARAPQAARAR